MKELARERVAANSRRVKAERVDAWKSWISEALKSKPKEVMKWCRDASRSSVTMLQKSTGALTANVAEMDSLICDAWLPVLR
eukprot:12418694-Karenia_brevis.AAC.1